MEWMNEASGRAELAGTCIHDCNDFSTIGLHIGRCTPVVHQEHECCQVGVGYIWVGVWASVGSVVLHTSLQALSFILV
jgi:hypothetical protein